jgi:transcriptional regulator
MYCPAHFHEDRPPVLVDLIDRYPLGAIIRHDATGLVADHIPLRYEPTATGVGRLVGHIAKNNPLWQCAAAQEFLVVFQGPSTYISPNWYPTKQDGGRVVPTWNYAVVHAHCTLRTTQDREQLLGLVNELTNQHEATQAHPWQVADAPPDYTEKLLGHIVGISFEIHRWYGKWKVSQNQPSQNRASLVHTLSAHESGGQAQMAALIQAHGPE